MENQSDNQHLCHLEDQSTFINPNASRSDLAESIVLRLTQLEELLADFICTDLTQLQLSSSLLELIQCRVSETKNLFNAHSEKVEKELKN